MDWWRSRGNQRRLRVTSYTHGTISNRNDVASVAEDDTSRAVALMFGGAGLVVSAPDYLGLGLGPGQHPYGHLASSTTASADLLVATRTLAAGRGIGLDHDVLVSGFSRGGTIAVDLGKALQRGAVPGFRLGKVAAVAGPYDCATSSCRGSSTAGVEPKIATYYVAYLVTAWQRLIGLYDDPAEAFRPPYHRAVEGLYDGQHNFEDILAGLPATPAELFRPGFEHRLLHPTGRYAELLRAGDGSCRGWTRRRRCGCTTAARTARCCRRTRRVACGRSGRAGPGGRRRANRALRVMVLGLPGDRRLVQPGMNR